MRNPNQIRSIIEHKPHQLTQRIIDFLQATPVGQRKLIGIVGAPASGKSTLMASLVSDLQSEFGHARVVGIPMDGFHLDNVQLELAGSTSRKGAPHTFDVGGLVSMVQRIASNESPVYAPEFDRASDLSRNCAIKVGSDHDVVIIEGNYLLLKQAGWQDIAECLNLSINIEVPEERVLARLLQRWLDHGLSADDALARAQLNDIPNAVTVRAESIDADIVYRPEQN